MPTYRYRCARCGDELDVWQSIHDPALSVHDGECGGDLVKVLGVGGIVLKGPGFYRTDSRAARRSKNGDGRSSESGGSDSGGSDSGNGAEKKTGSGDKATTATASKSESKKT
jgi:putative FmdB family regulatory protein